MAVTADDREQGLATVVKERRDSLLALLKARGLECSLSGFEDAALRLAEDDQEVDRAVSAFQAAVNALWLHAENTGVTSRVLSRWRSSRRQRIRAAGAEAAELDAEATFTMRKLVVKFEPGRAPLLVFAQRELFAALDAYLGRSLSPVHLPDNEARRQPQKGSRYGRLEESAE